MSTTPATLTRIISGGRVPDAAGHLPLGGGAAVGHQPARARSRRRSAASRPSVPDHLYQFDFVTGGDDVVRDGVAVRSREAGRRRTAACWSRTRTASTPRIHVFDASGAGAPTEASAVRRRHGERTAAARDRLVLTRGETRGRATGRSRRLGARRRASARRWRRRRRCPGASARRWSARATSPTAGRPRAASRRRCGPGRRRAQRCPRRRAGSSRPTSAPTSCWRRWSRPSGSSACRPTSTIRRPRTAAAPTRRASARLRADPETIIALAPDLVCVAGFTASDPLRLLVGAGLPVVRWSRFDSFADVMAEIRLIGAAVGEEARADALAGRHRGAARRSRAPARAASGRCASSTTIRRPTRWAAARWWARS